MVQTPSFNDDNAGELSYPTLVLERVPGRSRSSRLSGE